MSKTSRPSSDSFWRCERCNTPNPIASYLTNCLGCGAARDSFIESRTEPTETPAPTPGVTQQIRRRRMRLLATTIVYSAAVFLASTMVRIVGDSWLPSLLLLLSPRWLFLLPAPFLLFWAWRLKRVPVAAMLVVDVLFVLGPLMGFGVPWGRLDPVQLDGPVIRVMTFNRGAGKVDVPRLSRYVERHKIDVICFQDFAADPALDAYFDGERWYHDATRSVVSRFPIVEELPRPVEHNLDKNRYTLTAFRVRVKPPNGSDFVVASIQLPTMRHGLNRLFQGNVEGFRTQAEWWSQEFTRLVDIVTEPRPTPVIVGGDFNMPIESNAMYSLIDNGMFISAFEQAGLGWGYTRPSSFSWVRIDHILCSPDCDVRQCWIGPSFNSDHKSVIAEVALPASNPDADAPAQPAQP